MESQRHVSSAFRGEINKSVAMAENGRVIGRESWMRRNNKMVARRAHRDTRAVVSARRGQMFSESASRNPRRSNAGVPLSSFSFDARTLAFGRRSSAEIRPPRWNNPLLGRVVLLSFVARERKQQSANRVGRDSFECGSSLLEEKRERRERPVRLLGILARSRSSIRFNLSLSFSLLPFPTFAKGLSAPITGTKYFEFIQQLFCLAVKLRHVRWNGRFERGRDTAGRMDSIHQSTDPPIFPQSDESRGLSTLDGTQGDQPSVHKPLPIGFRP